jgi:hypothetical protein
VLKFLLDGPVQDLVTFPTKRNQISFGVIAKRAAPFQVVNIEISEAATYLTAPVITRQDFPTQPRIRGRGYSDSEVLLQDRVAHVTFPVGSDGRYAAAEQSTDPENS